MLMSLSIVKCLTERGMLVQSYAALHWICEAKLLVIHSCFILDRRGNLLGPCERLSLFHTTSSFTYFWVVVAVCVDCIILSVSVICLITVRYPYKYMAEKIQLNESYNNFIS